MKEKVVSRPKKCIIKLKDSALGPDWVNSSFKKMLRENFASFMENI